VTSGLTAKKFREVVLDRSVLRVGFLDVNGLWRHTSNLTFTAFCLIRKNGSYNFNWQALVILFN
jgi:hypothetical protein